MPFRPSSGGSNRTQPNSMDRGPPLPPRPRAIGWRRVPDQPSSSTAAAAPAFDARLFGRRLSTLLLASGLGVAVRLLPASDDAVRTFLTTPAGELDFQTWFVARRHADPVHAVRYDGAEDALPAHGVLDAIGQAEIVFIAPSNPFVSILPILAVPPIRAALAGKRVVAVSPLVGGKALRGPLADMMDSLGHEPGVRGIAALYEGIATDVVVDAADEGELDGALVAPIVMVEPQSRAEVGRAVLDVVR